jgi:hypothetical protein
VDWLAKCVSIPYWLGSKLRGQRPRRGSSTVSIPYWLGSKLRARWRCSKLPRPFQSPIGWGLSCESGKERMVAIVSIPYWLGSKLRGDNSSGASNGAFQSPIGWGLSCESCTTETPSKFQSPIGWGLSCEPGGKAHENSRLGVSIPYWLGSKLRGMDGSFGPEIAFAFQSPIGWGLSCECRAGR